VPFPTGGISTVGRSHASLQLKLSTARRKESSRFKRKNNPFSNRLPRGTRWCTRSRKGSTTLLKVIIPDRSGQVQHTCLRVATQFERDDPPHRRSEIFFDPAPSRSAGTAKLAPDGAQTVAVPAAPLRRQGPRKTSQSRCLRHLRSQTESLPACGKRWLLQSAAGMMRERRRR